MGANEAVPERPLLKGERTWLRPMEERDLASYIAAINDTEVGAKAGFRMPLSPAMAKAWLDKVMAAMASGDGYYFSVCELGSDAFIGTTWLKGIDAIAGSAELAICMDRHHIGSGWGTDAQRALISFGFGTLGLRRIWLTAFADNARAVRSYEKLGFRHEGLIREHQLLNGRARDSVLMAILRRDWRPNFD